PGLKEFTKLRIGNGKALAKAVTESPKYFASLRTNAAKVDALKPAMLAAFQCLRNLYPAAVTPEVYFLVGRMNSAGTVDATKLLIGFDMFGKTDEASIAELGAWHRAVVSPVERLPYIVAHELIHAQQLPPKDNSLLGAALFEGVADFVGELISGQTINPHLHAFARNRHLELWQAFEPAMLGGDKGRWLYQGENATPEWPADLGYYMGYRIAEAYYQRTTDKSAAVRDMLNITDPRAFLKASGYAEKMRGRK
ncbi:MAG: hypothetical protein JNK75_11435, partial [Betaproteobacteria bacterium]|nr:hypothetical protein [Betaproteobacteria bacterium]